MAYALQELDFEPSAIVADMHRNQVYIADGSLKHVLVLDTDLGRVTEQVNLWSTAGSLAVSPDGSELYAGEGNVIEVFSLPDLGLKRTLWPSVAAYQLAAGVNDKLYSHTDQIYQLDATTGSVLGSIPDHNAYDEYRLVRVSPDGTRLALFSTGVFSADRDFSYYDISGSGFVALGTYRAPCANGRDLAVDSILGPLNQEIPVDQLSGLAYTADSGYAGSDSFEWNASDGELYAASGAIVNLTIINPPTATVVLIPVSPTTKDTLTATATKSDLDGDTVNLTFVWKVNGIVKRTFASATALTDTFDLSAAGNGDHGDLVTVEVTPNDGTLDGVTVGDSATIVNAPPLATVLLNSQAPTTVSTIYATATKSDADGDPVRLTFVWKVNGVVKRTFTSATALTDSFNLSVAGNGDGGDVIAVTVTPNDGGTDGVLASASATVVPNAAPRATVALSPQSPKTSATLTATATKSDSNGDPVRLTFIWKVNGVVKRNFSSATALSDAFNLGVAGNGDRGDVVSVTITPNDGYVNGTAVTALVTVADTAPVFHGAFSQTVMAGITTVLPPSGFVSLFSDADAADTLKKIMVTRLPMNGVLKLNGVALVVNQEIPVGQLGALSYTPRTSYVGLDGFDWKLSDGTLYSPLASPATLTVTKLQPTSVLSWTTTPEIKYGQAVNVNAIVTSDSSVLPTGAVQFLEQDGTVLTTLTLVNGQVTGQIAGMKRGYHNLTAKYLGDATFNALSSTRDMPIHVGADNVVDVLVLYTATARQQIAGYNVDINDLIYKAIADANDAFVNSLINLSLELVDVEQTSYSESGSFDTDITRLATRGDGYMDDAFTLRDTYGADLVSLFVGSGDLGGIGYVMQNGRSIASNATLGFSVVLAAQSAAPYDTLAHELGHNFGAVHDREHADDPGYFYDSYGYRYTGSDGVLYHDIMSYDPGQTIPYFANPSVSYAGQPTGSSGSNVARTINYTAPLVAQYRPTKVPLVTPTQTTLSFSSLFDDGSAMTITANVAELAANPQSPSGTVSFLDGEKLLGSAALANGQASWTGSLPANTTHAVRALYQADDFYGDSISAATSLAGHYIVEGTANPDTINVTVSGSVIRVTLDSAVVREVQSADFATLTIYGRGSSDRITVAGALTRGLIIEGNDGNDTISGGSGNDTIRGGAGADSIIGNAGADLIEGGAGNDWAAGMAGNDTFVGGIGNDTVYGGPGADSLLGNDGDDLIWGGAGNDYIDAGAGNDVAVGELDDDFIIGGDGDDTIAGSWGNDLMGGQAGVDMVLGNAGNDTLYGGIGTDSVDGGPGDDLLYGDEISGYPGDSDRLSGGDGNDTLHGGIGRDTLWGNFGNDVLYGEDSMDQLWGGPGSDTLTGGAGSDTLLGEGEDDWLYADGDGAVDILRGDAGFDHARRGPNDSLLDIIEDVTLGAS